MEGIEIIAEMASHPPAKPGAHHAKKAVIFGTIAALMLKN